MVTVIWDTWLARLRDRWVTCVDNSATQRTTVALE